MAQRTITESQYMELRRYEAGHDSWVQGGPLASLVNAGLIRDDGRARSFYRITEAGRAALSAFRARYGVTA